MTINIGAYRFDIADYDEQGDVLYLHVGQPRAAEDTDETPEGHVVRLDADGRVIGLTIIGARRVLERDGALSVTLPTVRIDAAAVAPVLLRAS